MYSFLDSRTLMETSVNIYSLLILGCVFLQEFMKCFLCDNLVENFKIITHYSGKGLIFILISFIFMSHQLGIQQNYSAYLLFSVGILLIASDCKLVSNDENSNKIGNSNKIEIEVLKICDTEMNKSLDDFDVKPSKKNSANPYDAPEDF